MRTPLCVFKNILSNAMAGALGSISPKLRSNLETANRNIDRLARIVNDFLDVAKMESGKMQLCLTMIDMQVLIREIAETFMLITAQKNICFDTVLSDNKIAVEGDHDKLVQIFTNLIGNAIKFTPGGGQILVTVSNYDDKISVAIHDTGKGIAPQHLDKIFDRFETGATSANSGQLSTGLGLNIAKELVELHHGKIWVESIVGEGSTFTFTLPKKQPKKN
jgi:signal transduction histidine kinase